MKRRYILCNFSPLLLAILLHQFTVMHSHQHCYADDAQFYLAVKQVTLNLVAVKHLSDNKDKSPQKTDHNV